MWKHRQAKDYFSSEKVNDTSRDCISKKKIKEFLDRLARSEIWLMKNLLGENYSVIAGAVNVEVSERGTNVDSKTLSGDLYVIQNKKNGKVSFKLYSYKENKFTWAVDNVSNLNGYVDLKCNTHILHYGDSIYTFKFPDKRERTLFRDNLDKFIFFEKSKR